MATACEDTVPGLRRNADQRKHTYFVAYSVGVAGVITKDGGSPQVALTHGSTGVYTGTCPTGAILEVAPSFKSASATIDSIRKIAVDASAGTFSLTCYKDNGDGVPAAADPANGDKIKVRVTLYEATY